MPEDTISGWQGCGRERKLTGVEEHVTDRRRLLVDFERMAGKHDPLRDDARRVRVEEAARGDQVRRCSKVRIDQDHVMKTGQVAYYLVDHPSHEEGYKVACCIRQGHILSQR